MKDIGKEGNNYNENTENMSHAIIELNLDVLWVNSSNWSWASIMSFIVGR